MKIRILIIVFASLFLGYFLITIISRVSKSMNDHKKARKTILRFEIPSDDSLVFNPKTISRLNLVYSSMRKDLNHFSLYSYGKNYNLIVRNINSKRVDLKRSYKILYGETKLDVMFLYSRDEAVSLKYMTCLERFHKPNSNIIVDGNEIRVLKATKDTLLFHGRFYAISFGKKDKYINEGIFMINEMWNRDPIEMDILLINRENGLNLLVIYPEKESFKVPDGITLKLI